jgi:hypothetical protein
MYLYIIITVFFLFLTFAALWITDIRNEQDSTEKK